MIKTINLVSQKLNLPYWWVRAIAIEYTECRDYAIGDEIWTFNFNKLSKNDLIKAVQSHHTIVHGILMHNISPDVWSSRLIKRLVSDIPPKLSKDPDDILAEGLVSEYHFPFLANPIEIWDPKLDFSRCFQVLDNNRIWQWQIAKFINVKGQKHGIWTSEEINLESLDQIREKLAKLRNNKIKVGEPGYTEFKEKVIKFYELLDKIRHPILSNLWEIHLKKRSKFTNFPKVSNYKPPQLSHFESFTVCDNKIYTKFYAAPVFFISCKTHAIEAEKLAKLTKSGGEFINMLDKIYQERTNAIVLGAACIEAFINTLGFEHFPKLWKEVERLPFPSKWQCYLALKSKGDLFDASREPYQTLSQLYRKRNKIMHFKEVDYSETHQKYNKTITHVEYDLSRDFVRRLPDQIVCLIEELCIATTLPKPSWLKL